MKLVFVFSFVALLCISVKSAKVEGLRTTIYEFDTHTDVKLERYECYAKVMNEVSIANGEEKEWAQYYSKIQHHIDNWGRCLFDVRCKRLEMLGTHFALEDYKQIMKAKNPQILNDYERQINAKCSTKSDDELLAFEKPDKLQKYFQCLANAMGLAWEANGEGKRWSKYQSKVQIHLDNWKKCLPLENPDDRNACIKSESLKTYDIWNECVIAMSSMNPRVLRNFSTIALQNCAE